MIKQTPTRDSYDQLMVPIYTPQTMIPVRGEGSRIWDQQGNEYIDFAGGVAVSALGHGHPQLLQALKDQADKIWHLSNLFTNEPVLQLAQQLVESTFAERVLFCNSGAEANEAALKLARKYADDHFGPEKNQIIAFNQSFHGRTLFTVSVGGQQKYRQGFGPLPQGITHVDFNDLDAFRAVISDNSCAVIMEPIQGEGGIIPADPEFVRGVRDLCDRHNALLIFDEIQTGVGRTGHLYAYQGIGVTPDILTSAKALGCGFPIGAMLTSAKIAQSLSAGTHGNTYGGNPLACAVASEVLAIINTPEVLEGVKRKHDLFITGLALINEKYGIFNDLRGEGLLIGAELVDRWHGKAAKFVTAALAEGLTLLVAGPKVLRMAPSLLISDEEIKEGFVRLERAVGKTVEAATNG